MHHELGITTVYVTHDQAEAMTLGDRVVVMNEGIIQQNAPPLEVYNSPANRFVASFIGSPAMNFFDFRYSDGKLVDAAATRILVPEERRRSLVRFENKPVVLGVRPEHLRLISGSEKGEIQFTIDVAQKLGHETLLDITNEDKQAVVRVSPNAKFEIGETREFAFEMDKIQFFDPETGVNSDLLL